MNRVQLIGRLGQDPVISRSGKGPVAHFSVATNEIWTDRETGERLEHTEWHQAVCFDRHAEIIGSYLTKGDEVFIEGRQRTTQWIDKDGKTQKGVQVRVDRFRMFARTPREEIARVVRGLELAEDAIHKIVDGKPVNVTLAEVANMLDVLRWELAGRPESGTGSAIKGPATHGASAG